MNKPINKEQYVNQISCEEDDVKPDVTINIQYSDQSEVGSHCSCEELSAAYASHPGSRSPSLASRDISVAASHNCSVHGSRDTVNSARSTPKVLRLPHLQRLRSAGVLNWSRGNLSFKTGLKRTTSHTPRAHRPADGHNSLRRTRSSTSHVKEDRYSGNLSMCSYTTSSESLSSEAQSPTVKYCFDLNHGKWT